MRAGFSQSSEGPDRWRCYTERSILLFEGFSGNLVYDCVSREITVKSKLLFFKMNFWK